MEIAEKWDSLDNFKEISEKTIESIKPFLNKTPKGIFPS